ncbi:MAG: 4'-phosphopantetheinyl transferase superfamily protein [Chlamydiae bacterium]|nr:4'-phosphopantetheinyl transferase superfamily protein [Chlamydiota bacterium]MBI3265734.1 4'-phosphopantetheinyl transferase superfamily protein [Chlamydiota bacterium]
MIGIDIIDMSRAKSIYETYESRLSRYLSPGELHYIRRSRSRPRALGEILALKEAVFKALEIPWFGLAGWKKIALKAQGKGRFAACLQGSLARSSSGKKIFLNVAATPEFILARAMLVSSGRDETGVQAAM